MSKYVHIWHQKKKNHFGSQNAKIKTFKQDLTNQWVTSIFYIQSTHSVLLLISPKSTTDLDTHTHTHTQMDSNVNVTQTNTCGFFLLRRSRAQLSLSPSLSVHLSLPFLFLSAMSCGSSELHPRLFGPYVLPCLFLTIPPTHTHVLTRTVLHPLTYCTPTETYARTQSHSAWQLNMGSMCLCFHSIACYSFLFPVSVLKGYLVPARAPVITIASLAEGRFSFLFVYRKFTIFDGLSFKTSSWSVLKLKVICVKIIP